MRKVGMKVICHQINNISKDIEMIKNGCCGHEKYNK